MPYIDLPDKDRRQRRREYMASLPYRTRWKYKDYQREWEKRNATRLAAKRRHYYRAHRDRIKARVGNYQHRNKQKRRAWSCLWRKNHPFYHQQYRRSHLGRCRELARQSYRRNYPKNKAKMVIRNRFRRAVKKGVIVNPKMIEHFFLAVKSKHFAVCYYCGRRFPSRMVHQEHVIAIRNGGMHEIGNLCVSCPPCNLTKQKRTISQWNKSDKLGQLILL